MLMRDIALHLQSLSIGTYNEQGVGGTIYISTLPPTPNDCIFLRDTGGPPTELALVDYRRTFQVITRSVGYELANQKAWAIHTALKGYLRLPNDRQMIIRSINPPASIGQDNLRRYEFSTNYFLWTKGD